MSYFLRLVGLFSLGTLIGGCAFHRPEEKAAPAAVSQKTVAAELATKTGPPPADPFEVEVKPMLARTCSPCHVPGGKMYGRLPFDNRQVVSSKKDSILGRLKAPEDKLVLERWIETATKSPPGR